MALSPSAINGIHAKGLKRSRRATPAFFAYWTAISRAKENAFPSALWRLFFRQMERGKRLHREHIGSSLT
jgi:hypothetical protein